MTRAFHRNLLFLLTAALCAAASCKERPRPIKLARTVKPKAEPPPAVQPVQPVQLPDRRYATAIRPLFDRHGCTGQSCHGTFKGGGLQFTTGEPNSQRDYDSVISYIDKKQPRQSLLIKKALGEVEHNGGKNLAPGECDTRRVLAWIGGTDDIPCDEPPPVHSAERFAREAAPALRGLGCAQGACHGSGGKGVAKLDLSARIRGQPEAAYASFQGTGVNAIVTWMSPVIKAAWGELPEHPAVDLGSCAYRRLHTFVSGSPETRCEIGAPLSGMPSQKDFGAVVMPSLARRGCLDGSCHGGAAGGLSLFTLQGDRHAALHDYLVLTARVEDLRRPNDSLLLRTVRNHEPHGGGQRLGGKGDCLDDMVVAWLGGSPVTLCPKPKPPSYARFVTEIQPVLDRMTCTQAACHASIPAFKLLAKPDQAGLLVNYQAVLREIDYDFMPFSGVQLRMREPCAYSVVGAWIEGRPRPTCQLKDPDPSIFPRLEKKLAKKG